jgi:hypothetical protein
VTRQFHSFFYRISFCCFVFFYLFLSIEKLCAATEIYLSFQNSEGQKVQLSKAELLLAAWNYTGRIPLSITDDKLDLFLDSDWLKKNWPDQENHFRDLEKVYLYLQAPGYAPVCSVPIPWMGSTSNDQEKGVLILFPGGKPLPMMKHQLAELKVTFHRPRSKFLRFIDIKGKPLEGVRVRSFIFWSNSNPEGWLEGAEPLADGNSDSRGKIQVPDGDFVHAFLIKREGYVLKEPDQNSKDSSLIIRALKSKDTTIILKPNVVLNGDSGKSF